VAEKGENMVHKRILIVEDEKAVRDTMIDLLSEAGFEVEGAPDGEEAIEKVRETGFNIVITDLKMPRGDGLHVLEQVKKTSVQDTQRWILQ
jgi:CheY-like chemotaxis protein